MKRTLIILFTLFAMVAAGSAYADETTSSVSDVTASISQFNEAADLSKGRGFAIPGEIIFPGTPSYFGEATPGHRFIPLNKLLMFTTVWDANKAANMLNGRTGNKDVQLRDLYADLGTVKADKVYCSIVKPQELGASAVDQVSIGTIAATNRKSISADVLATAIVAAAERGANYIMFMAEGVNREVDAQGFGIGLNYTKATLNGSDNDSSGVASGGLGYSRGWAGYIDYPWLQFTILKVEGIEGLAVAALPPAPEPTAAVVIDDALKGKENVKPVNFAVVEQGSTSGVRINPAD
jgi:hypothetical protein